MQFSDVIGQEPLKAKLREMVDQNRLSHALLFLGKEGCGALSLARAFAQYVMCQKVNGQEEWKDSCGECANCQKSVQMIHPDIHYSYPVIPRKQADKPISTDYASDWREFMKMYSYGNSYDWLQFIGAENKQGNITAAECSDIIRKLNLKSYEGNYKILILWLPEYLDKEGNKLLKLIEEPPPQTLFILVAENESKILPTILSRCQLVKVPTIDREELTKGLEQRAQLPYEQAFQIASVADGNYREALQLLQHADEDWQSLLRDWLNAVLKNGPLAQYKWVEEVAKLGREKQKQFLRYFNHLLEQSVRLKLIGERLDSKGRPQVVMPANELDFANRLNKIVDISQIQSLAALLDDATYHIERNANAKILFHALTIKLYHIIADKSLILTGGER